MMQHFQHQARQVRDRTPGVLVALVIALASGFVADHHGGPTLLYALLLGMAMNHLSAVPRYLTGIQWTATTVLRLGVALLGARITLEQILALGSLPLVMVLCGVPLTIFGGMVMARWLKLSPDFGVLSGVSVAVCGASAAMATACVLPRHEDSESMLIFTVIGVTSLSTLAMILYPVLVGALGLDHVRAGIFIGGTIHDVAQVVGAGYLLGDEAGNTATFTKLLRVATLVPVIMLVSFKFRSECESGHGKRPPPLPGFLVAFVGLVVINSLGWIPGTVTSAMTDFSRWCLLTAIAAVGIKANLKKLSELGWRPLALLVAETANLALFGLILLLLYP